jgi:hypothetical protein
MPWSTSRPKTSHYGAAHAKARREFIARHKPWHICGWCGEQLGPASGDLHLAHTPDRQHYVGLWHAACNLQEAAKRGRAMQDASTLRW